MTLARTGLLAFLLLPLLGCKAETFGGDDVVVDPAALTVTSGVAMPGATITISAPWMAQVAESLWLGVDDAPPVRAGRDSGGSAGFRLALPTSLAAGGHEIFLGNTASDRTLIGEITSGGSAELRYAAGSLYGGQGETQPLPELLEVAGVGGPIPGGSSVVVVDVANAVVRPVGTTPICCYGVGASYRLGAFLAYRGTPGWEWNLISRTAVTTRIDSLPLIGNNWPKHEIAPGLYLSDDKNVTYLQVDSTSVEFIPNYYHPSRIAFSPDGKWAVASHSTSASGALIVDRASGAYHWSAGWMNYTRPIFLRDGRLVVYGWRRDPDYSPATYGPIGEYLAHVDPTTGALLDSVRFANSGSAYDLPFASTETGWIVLPAWHQDHIELSIRDPDTFVEIAHAISPIFANQCDGYNTIATLEDAGRHRLYFVVNNCTGQVPIWTLELPG